MKQKIKICGLSTPEAVEAAVSGGATHLGFIFFEKSPRNVSAQTAGILTGSLHSQNPSSRAVQTVAVTVDASDQDLDHIVEHMRPDMLQLHGSESVAAGAASIESPITGCRSSRPSPFREPD